MRKMKRRGIRFHPENLERGRRYMWKEEFLPILYKYLFLSRNQIAVDVGCGTGFLTRLVSRGMTKTGQVIGIDRNPELLSAAKIIARREGFSSKMISFKKGSAEALPVKSDYADTVMSQTLLWIVKEPRKVLQEMIRVAKPGGLIAALDWGFDSIIHYFPDEQDKELNHLHRVVREAEVLGYKRLYGNDRIAIYKAPTIFKELGLQRVRLDSYGHSHLASDDRLSLDYTRWYHRINIKECSSILCSMSDSKVKGKRHEHEFVRILRLSGMARGEIRRFCELHLNRNRRLLGDEELLKNDTAIDGGVMFIVSGIKPSLRR